MPPTDSYYVTTPIYYVNDRPHIGHVYTTTLADVLARWRRLRGEDVFFLTGTDEHAAKVVESAAKRGVSTQEWADRNAAEFERCFARLGIANSDFIRTSQERHKRRVREYVQALTGNGSVYLGEYEGWYDPGQEEYVTQTLAQEHDYKSPISGRPLVRRKEKNYFFRLSAFREPLLELLERGGEVDGCRFEVLPAARRNEIVERIRVAEDIPVSRDVVGSGLGDWCIRMPGDETQAVYVWIDALFNYLSAVDEPERRRYWAGGAVHLIAKDILWFHAAVWPAMLLALRRCPGYEWVGLPARVYAHSFWIAEGRKMSKSEGNFIDLEKLDGYVSTFSLDALRWFLVTQGPLGATDSDFAEAKFIEVYNADLANTLGNSFSRVSNMTARYFEGKTPAPASGPDPLAQEVARLVADHARAMDALKLGEAAQAALSIVAAVDLHIESTQPFKMAKDPALLPRVGEVLYRCAEALRIASVLLWPVMPGKCAEVWRRMGLGYAQRLEAGPPSADSTSCWTQWTAWGGLRSGDPIEKGDALFMRYQPAK